MITWSIITCTLAVNMLARLLKSLLRPGMRNDHLTCESHLHYCQYMFNRRKLKIHSGIKTNSLWRDHALLYISSPESASIYSISTHSFLHNEPQLVLHLKTIIRLLQFTANSRANAKTSKEAWHFAREWISMWRSYWLPRIWAALIVLKEKEEGESQGLHHVLIRLLDTYSCRKGFWLKQL